MYMLVHGQVRPVRCALISAPMGDAHLCLLDLDEVAGRRVCRRDTALASCMRGASGVWTLLYAWFVGSLIIISIVGFAQLLYPFNCLYVHGSWGVWPSRNPAYLFQCALLSLCTVISIRLSCQLVMRRLARGPAQPSPALARSRRLALVSVASPQRPFHSQRMFPFLLHHVRSSRWR